MKKNILLVLFVFASFYTYSQNTDIIGYWKMEDMNVDIKTNYPLLTKDMKDRFQQDVKDDNGNPVFANFAIDGKTYDQRGFSKEYILKNDSIYVGEVSGIFTIKNNTLTITCDLTKEMIANMFYFRSDELAKLEIPDVDSIRLERVVLEYQFLRCDSMSVDSITGVESDEHVEVEPMLSRIVEEHPANADIPEESVDAIKIE